MVVCMCIHQTSPTPKEFLWNRGGLVNVYVYVKDHGCVQMYQKAKKTGSAKLSSKGDWLGHVLGQKRLAWPGFRAKTTMC